MPLRWFNREQTWLLPPTLGELVPMLEQAENITGKRSLVTLADGGYHTAANLMAGKDRGQTLVMAERYQAEVHEPYFKDHFDYDPDDDCYICPHHQRLSFRGLRKSPSLVCGQSVSTEHRGQPVAAVQPTVPVPGTNVVGEPCGSALLINYCVSTDNGC